jgi:NTE family protein
MLMELSLALGGGGVKGISHIGVLQCLEGAGYKIGAIAGTSAGSIIGAAYAAGYTPSQLTQKIQQLDQSWLFDRTPDDGPSLLGLKGFNKFLTNLLGNRTFDDLRIPFSCTAVDLKTQKEIVLTRGPVIDAVRASIAVPGIFPPIRSGDRLLIDGGVVDLVPVAVARWLLPKKPTIAVCLTPIPEKWAELPRSTIPTPISIPQPIIERFSHLRLAQAFDIFIESIDITSRMVSELRLQIEKPDVIIRPKVDLYKLLDRVNPQELIKEGERSTKEALEEIRNSFTWIKQIQRNFKQPNLPDSLCPYQDMTDRKISL